MKFSFLFFIFLFSLLVLTPLISAPPPFQCGNPDIGLKIEAPAIEYIEWATDFKFRIHVYNVTDGLLMTNDTVACIIHVYDSHGNHLIETDMGFDSNGIDFKYDALGSNFTVNNQYAVLYYCYIDPDAQAGIDRGGFLEYPFYVTPSGEVQYSFFENPLLLILILIGTMLLFSGIYFNNPAVGFLGAILFILSGLYSILDGINNIRNIYTNGVGATLIGIGIIFMLAAAYDWVYNIKEDE